MMTMDTIPRCDDADWLDQTASVPDDEFDDYPFTERDEPDLPSLPGLDLAS
ncbi:hypothetical protein [Gordonia shandongensis]|uniref:hypothetical protein n=1 Tax=Gordonia shandongensis TaxID=376351 RepID=UPI00041A0F17|nr:hypothetical protein [Gordonia shandongensis]